jgi:TRAP-type C4-dicarboxylate transport system permease small subunit
MLKRFYNAVCRTEALVAAILLVVMVVLIFLGGVARMLGEPLVWTTDFATCAFAWACFLAADVAWRNYAIISAFLVYVIIAGLWLSWVSRARSFQGIPEISYSWVMLSLPVGGILLLVTTILRAHMDFYGRPQQQAPESATRV